MLTSSPWPLYCADDDALMLAVERQLFERALRAGGAADGRAGGAGGEDWACCTHVVGAAGPGFCPRCCDRLSATAATTGAAATAAAVAGDDDASRTAVHTAVGAPPEWECTGSALAAADWPPAEDLLAKTAATAPPPAPRVANPDAVVPQPKRCSALSYRPT